MPWTDYASAPLPGTPVCDAARVEDALCLTVTTDRGAFPMLLVRTGGELRAYVNACPHQFLPLDWRSARILSADGTMLMCSAHGARFAIATGACLGGADEGLDPVPIRVTGGRIVIAG